MAALSAPLDLVVQAAQQLRIDLKEPSQIHLLAVANAFLLVPLPTFWKRVLDENGTIFFLDRRTQQAFPEHPQLKQLLQACTQLAADPPVGFQQRTRMRLSRSDGTEYLHDFAVASTPGDSQQARNYKSDTTTSAGEQPQAPLAPILAAEPRPEDTSSPPSDTAAVGPGGSSPSATDLPEASKETPPVNDPSSLATALGAGPSAAALPDPAAPLPEPATADQGVAPEDDDDGSRADSRVILDLPISWLQKFGLLPSEQKLSAVPPLRFYSWWYEDVESADLTNRVSGNSEVGGGLRRRYVMLDYDLPSLQFSMRSANDDQELVMLGPLPVLTKAGQQAEVWDLHVGAALKVMGRPITLLKADGVTSIWLERHSKMLLELKSEILTEIQKYKPKAFENKLAFNRGNGASHPRGDKGALAGLCLRFTVEQVNQLLVDLQQYRPDKIEKLRSRITVKI